MQSIEDQLKWCLEQKRGIKMIQPSENLSKAYLRKMGDALRSMEVNAGAGLADWTISASYYAKYFAVYALLMRIGIRSEIHECTVALFTYLFRDEAPKSIIRDLAQSRRDRIETQYYTQTTNFDLEGTMRKTREFTLEIEKLLDELTNETIDKHRSRAKDLFT